MRAIFELAAKDLTLLRRDRPTLFWTFAWPLLFALFFGFLMSGMSGGRTRSAMSVAVVDLAGTPASARFVERLGASPSVTLEPMPLEEARDAVRRGRKVALVVVPEGFGEGLSQFSGEGPALRIGVDPSRNAEAGFLQGILTEASFGMMQERMQDASARNDWQIQIDSAAAAGTLPAEVAGPLRSLLGSVGALQSAEGEGGGSGGFGPPPIEQEPLARLTTAQPRSSFDITFPSAILWGLIACSSGFAVSLVLERYQGTLLRLQSAPLGTMRVLLGKALACFLSCMAVSIALLLVGVVVFRVHVGSPLGVAAALLATATCFTGLMMLFSAAGRTPAAVGGVSWAVMLVSSMIGGGMIPLIAMPAWMQSASVVSPVRWGIYSIEGAVWRDFSASEMTVPLLVLVAIGVVGFTVGARLFRASEA